MTPNSSIQHYKGITLTFSVLAVGKTASFTQISLNLSPIGIFDWLGSVARLFKLF